MVDVVNTPAQSAAQTASNGQNAGAETPRLWTNEELLAAVDAEIRAAAENRQRFLKTKLL